MSKRWLHTLRNNWTTDPELGDIPTPLARFNQEVDAGRPWNAVGWAAVLVRATQGGLYHKRYLKDLWEVWR